MTLDEGRRHDRRAVDDPGGRAVVGRDEPDAASLRAGRDTASDGTGAGGCGSTTRMHWCACNAFLCCGSWELGSARSGTYSTRVSTPSRRCVLMSKLESERARLAAVVESVRSTIKALEKGEQLVADTMFNGFDHTQYKDEVVDRWGEAYTASDTWWRSLDGAGRKAFEDESSSLIKGFRRCFGARPMSTVVRCRRWPGGSTNGIRASWGGTAPSAEAFTGLGQMYVDDPRFGKTYSVDGREFAAFVRDAMVAFAEKEL